MRSGKAMDPEHTDRVISKILLPVKAKFSMEEERCYMSPASFLRLMSEIVQLYIRVCMCMPIMCHCNLPNKLG